MPTTRTHFFGDHRLQSATHSHARHHAIPSINLRAFTALRISNTPLLDGSVGSLGHEQEMVKGTSKLKTLRGQFQFRRHKLSWLRCCDRIMPRRQPAFCLVLWH